MTQFKSNDLTGQRFTRLIALKRIGQDRWGSYIWLCKCDCGKQHTVSAGALRCGNSKSCGCLRGESHGHTTDDNGKLKQTRTYRAWAKAKGRCYNQKDQKYRIYGARGIRMSDEWRASFVAFLRDMGEVPPGLTLDRIKTDGHYEKGNCRWATPLQQANNQRNTRFLTFPDGQVMTVTEAAGTYGVKRETLSEYLRLRGHDRTISHLLGRVGTAAVRKYE
jgi:hypothetical protein